MKLLAFSNRLKQCFFAIEGNIASLVLQSTANPVVTRTFVCDKSANTNVHVLAIDDEEKYLVAAFENKALACWDLETGELLGSRMLRKKPTAAQIGTWECEGMSRKVTVVSDKAGDIWAVRMPDLACDVLVAGHTASVVTDLAITADHRYIVSADRDEKLRFSSFPDLETVENYGLGHTSVVVSVETIPQSDGNHLIVSTGWDHKLLLWDFKSAQIIDEVAFREDKLETVPPLTRENGTKPSSNGESTGEGDDMIPEKDYNEKDAGNYPFKIVSNKVDTIAILFKDDSKVYIYKILDRKLQLAESVSLVACPLDVHFITDTVLLALLPKDHMVAVYNLSSKSFENLSNYVLSEALSFLQSQAGEFNGVLFHFFMSDVECKGAGFDQSIVSKGLGFDAETGMKKHALDRPFNEEEHINYNAKKGSKRSKK